MSAIKIYLEKIINADISFFIIGSFIILTLFSFLPPFNIDQNDWRYWSQRLVEHKFSNFYSKDIFTDYFPGYLYVFWIIGLIKSIFLPFLSYSSLGFDLLLKLPANLAHIFSGYIIYKIFSINQKALLGKIGFLLYVLNPALIFSTSIWGQFDTVSTLFLLLALLALLEKRPSISSLLFAISFSLKPQAIVFIPTLLISYILYYRPIQWIKSFIIFAITSIIIYLPFFPSNPLAGIFYLTKSLSGFYTCTTCFAFNFWGIFGNWQDDLITYLGLNKQLWGVVLFIISLVIIYLPKFRNTSHKPQIIFFETSISIIAFFTLLTRMHERYLFPFFAFFIIYSLFSKSKLLIIFYFIFSILHLVNLFIPYYYYNSNMSSSSAIFNLLLSNFQTFSFIFSLCFIFIMIEYINYRYVKKN